MPKLWWTYLPDCPDRYTDSKGLRLLLSKRASDSGDGMSVSDYYTNMNYWQEYDCAKCGGDFDVYPIPLPNTKVICPQCGHKQISGEGECNTYIKHDDQTVECVDYPQ